MTLETVIPPKPDKVINAPDEAAFHKKQLDIEERMKTINNTLEELKTKFETTLAEKHAHRRGNDGEGGVIMTADLKKKF